MKSKKPQISSTGIFWDYENIPFRHIDWRKFVKAIQAYIATHNVSIAKCFCRDLNMSDDDKENLQLIQHMKLKRVTGSEHNAVDNVLIQSCRATIHAKKEIQWIIIISGDGDFLPLVKDLQKQKIKVSLICPLAKGNLRLMNSVELFPYETLIAHPDSWWNYPHYLKKKKKAKKKVKHKQKLHLSQKPNSKKLFGDTDEEKIEPGVFVYDDGDGEYQGHDYNAPAFEDDESDEDEMVYREEEEYWY